MSTAAFENSALTSCVIIGAGPADVKPIEIPGAFVIAADGGYDTAKRFGIVPDVVLGDFDSMEQPGEQGFDNHPWTSEVGKAIPDAFDSSLKLPVRPFDPTLSQQKPRIMRFPREKDDTDMMLAIRMGYCAGCRTFYLYGGTGGRADHTVANIQALCWISRRGGRGYLVGGGRVYTTVTDGRILLAEKESGGISVFSLGETSKRVSICGLKYSMLGSDLLDDVPMGVSNEFCGECAEITVESGTLLITWEEDDFNLGRVVEHISFEEFQP